MREPPTPERDAARAGTRAAVTEGRRRTPNSNGPDQGTLPLPPSARPSDPGTSWAATRDRWGYRARIIDTFIVSIAMAGERGMNAADLQAVHGGETSRICRRLTDLVQLGWVRHVGERKSPRTGYLQRVYAATASGQQHAAKVIAATTEGAA